MVEVTRIPKRCEIPVEDTWALEDLFSSDEAWELELEALKKEVAVLATYSGRLAENGQVLYDYLTHLEQVNARATLLMNYCARRHDEDTRNTFYQAMIGRYTATAVEMNTACSFEIPEIMAIPDEKLEAFYVQCPQLERYRRYLNDTKRMEAHTLSPAEEKLLASAGELAQAPDTIYGAMMDADMVFPDAVDAEGNAHPVSHGTFVPLERSADRVLRQSAYESLYGTLGKFRSTTASILNAQNKQLDFFAKARKYPDALSAALDDNNVPTAVYHNLIDAVHNHLDKLHCYIRLRKKMLGVDELHFYDIYTPLMQGIAKPIAYADAKKTVYDALAPMGDYYRSILQKGFDSRWIDVYENEGKRSGAYSAGAAVHPYVLLNYSHDLSSEFTLAHEMGHAIHSFLSNKHQHPLDSHYVIFVAEVASTCNETLLMEYLLANTTEPKERAFLLNQFLEELKGTIYRQTMFAEFERFLGEMTVQGKPLTADILCEEYKRLNRVYYGEDIVVDDEIGMEWARIPHFFYNYYVYQYATGNSAAIAIARKILREGESAVEKYLGFLSGGCTKSPIDLLKGVGVDMTSPEPVNDALELFGQLLDELEELAGA